MPVILLHSSPQDSASGVSLDNIAERLTRKNWNSKAIVRLAELDPLYVWINRGERGKVRFYRVCVDGVEKRRKDLERDFSYLKDALASGNGQDGGELAKVTRPGRREDWPAHVTKEPPWIITFPMFRNLR